MSIRCNVLKPNTLTAGFSINTEDAEITCEETDEGVEICVRSEEKLSQEDIDDGILARVKNSSVEVVFLLFVQSSKKKFKSKFQFSKITIFRF